MTIYEKLRQMKNLTANETELVKYILDHPEEFIDASTKEIARVCYVSVPTIYRLCEKVGVSGLSELKVKLSAGLSDYLSANRDFDFDYPIKERESHEAIARNLKEDYVETVNATKNLMDMSEMHNAAHALRNAQRVVIFTSAGNLHFARNFCFQLEEIGIFAEAPSDEYEQRLLAAHMTSKDLAVIISFGGRGTIVHMTAEILKSNEVPILLISSAEENSLTPYAKIHLYLCNLESHYNKISSFSTRLSLLYVLDNLYAGLFNLDYVSNIDKKLDAYEALGNGTRKGVEAMIAKKQSG